MRIAGRFSTNRHRAQAAPRNGTFGIRPYTILYAIDAPEVARIKFGITSNIKKRFRQLCGGSPVPVFLMGYVWMPLQAENYTFEFLKEDRVHGEWFVRTERVRSIAALIAAKKDVDLAEILGLSSLLPRDVATPANPDYNPLLDIPYYRDRPEEPQFKHGALRK